MTDPFVQKMMARSQARRAILDRVLSTDTNKENSSKRESSPLLRQKSSGIFPSEAVKSPLKTANQSAQEMRERSVSPVKQYAKDHSFIGSRVHIEVSPEESKSDDEGSANSVVVCSYEEKKTEVNSSSRNVSPAKSSSFSSKKNDYCYSEAKNDYVLKGDQESVTEEPTPRRGRLGALAKRQQQMQEWEDDYVYHSQGAKGMEAFRGSRDGVKTNGSLSPTRRSPIKETTNAGNTPKYYFGQAANSGSQSGSPSRFVSPALSRSPSPSKFIAPQSPKMEYCRSFTGSPAKRLIGTRSPSVSPDRKLDWDRSIINSLEAQGFTPTESKSRLFYDFRKEQEDQKKGSFPEEESPHSQIPSPPPAPVRSNSLTKSPYRPVAVSKQEMPSSNRRDSSPSKVGDLRSRWETHINQPAPEPQQLRNRGRSLSPTKPGASIYYVAAATDRASRSRSPVKNESRSQEEMSPFSRSQRGRQSLRDLPRGGNNHSPVVKGEVPMPPTVPLIEQPFQSSVLARAKAFDSQCPKPGPQQDPAEMTLRERLGLFEKQKGNALVPKAPFGQSVPAKMMRVEEEKAPVTSKPKTGGRKPPPKRPVQSIIADRAGQIEHVIGSRSPSPQRQVASGIAAHRHLFEAASLAGGRQIGSDWRSNEINSKVQTERQKEMDVLTGRFRQPGKQSHDEGNESESEYQESDDDSYVESTTSDDRRSPPGGPPKPPRLYLDSHSGNSPVPVAPPMPGSPMAWNSTQKSKDKNVHSIATKSTTSPLKNTVSPPKKEFTPTVKPSCLYPALSDLESYSETVESEEESNSSFAESVLTCASLHSLGTKIQQVAQHGGANAHRDLSVIAESNCTQDMSISESTMDALEAIDDALDEAFSDNELPTPPKRGRSRSHLRSSPSSAAFKTPKLTHDSTSSDSSEDAASNLAHSISLYRKQRPTEVTYTPVKSIVRRPPVRSPPSPCAQKDSPSVAASARIRQLQTEVNTQQGVISQASSAVSVAMQQPEQQDTPQHVEAERLLLLATQRRQAALNEIQRLKSEGALKGQDCWGLEEDSCRGSLSISSISLPLKHDFLKKGMKGDGSYHVMVLLKHRDQVIPTQLLSTPGGVTSDGVLTFPNLVSLHDLSSDFSLSVEVYCLATDINHHLSIKKEPSRMKLTPLKRLKGHDKACSSPGGVQSPGGPYAVRSSSFQLVGFIHLNMTSVMRNAFTLEKVPFSCPLDGHLLMRVRCTMEGRVSERGFLTTFEDVGGFGAWNRRWCVLSGAFLRFWRYPDDENKKEALGMIDLRLCTTDKIDLVAREVCARQHTFQLTCVSAAALGDVNDLVKEVKGKMLVFRHLLSADSKEERQQWCRMLNKSLSNLRAWDPEALGPDHFQE